MRGKTLEFLGVNFDVREHKALNIDVHGHVDDVVDTFQDGMSEHPSNYGSFNEGNGALLKQKDKEQFHVMTAKGPNVSKRASPDAQQTVAVSCAGAQNPSNLICLLKFLNRTRKKLRITADDLAVIEWHVGASFCSAS